MNIGLYFNIMYSLITRTSREKETYNLNTNINTHLTLHPTTAALMYFSNAEEATDQDRLYAGP